MRKSTLFISAALTTFVLAILAGGVVSAYRGTVGVTEPAAPTQPAVEAVAEMLPPPTQASFTPEQAASLAAQVLGRTDLYSVETADLNGTSAYMVTFSSGEVVYVSLQGQILSITKPQTTVTTGFSTLGNNNAGGSAGNGGSEHEDHEEHEDDDD